MKLNNVLIILFVSTIGYIILPSILDEVTITLPLENQPTKGLVLSAYREGGLGAIRLDLYDDNRFEIWSSGLARMKLSTRGNYSFSGDTLTLLMHKNGVEKDIRPKRYLLHDGNLFTHPKGTSLFMGITLNKLKPQKSALKKPL